ncbi:8-amino-7-oxononanoate synthase [Planctomycetota bacterium]|nr:8-amino-7-oxononanoate synthase [Planctomycetota bacterium]
MPIQTESKFRQELKLELEHRDQFSMRRQLRVIKGNARIIEYEGKSYINLASNDYLGLSNHPHIKEAAINAIIKHGTGAGASKIVIGHQDIHHHVEKQFAAFKGAESALLLPTGYAANLAVLTSLAAPGDLICLDKLSHTSLIDAAKTSGATVRTFPHLQTAKLRKLLQRHSDASCCISSTNPSDTPKTYYTPLNRPPRRFIVADSVFSMDGDVAQLPELVSIAKEYDAILIIDEAHGTGLMGKNGSGLCESQNVKGQVDVIISTASKALGSLGGIVTADRIIIDTILNHGKTIIYTTSIPPAQAAAIGAAIEVIQNDEHRRHYLQQISLKFRHALLNMGWQLPDLISEDEITPIFPLILGSPEKAIKAYELLKKSGFLAFASRYPAVPRGEDRVRISLRADLAENDLDKLITAINSLN